MSLRFYIIGVLFISGFSFITHAGWNTECNPTDQPLTESVSIPSDLGHPISSSPDGKWMIVPVIDTKDKISSTLALIDPRFPSKRILLPTHLSAAFSSDGEWLVLANPKVSIYRLSDVITAGKAAKSVYTDPELPPGSLLGMARLNDRQELSYRVFSNEINTPDGKSYFRDYRYTKTAPFFKTQSDVVGFCKDLRLLNLSFSPLGSELTGYNPLTKEMGFYDLTSDGTCKLTHALELASGKIRFSPDGTQAVFHADSAEMGENQRIILKVNKKENHYEPAEAYLGSTDLDEPLFLKKTLLASKHGKDWIFLPEDRPAIQMSSPISNPCKPSPSLQKSFQPAQINWSAVCSKTDGFPARGSWIHLSKDPKRCEQQTIERWNRFKAKGEITASDFQAACNVQ